MADRRSGAKTEDVCVGVNHINKIGITGAQTSQFLNPFVATGSWFESCDSRKATEAKTVSDTTGHMSSQAVTNNLNKGYNVNRSIYRMQ